MQAIINISVDILKVHPRNAEFFDDISGEEYERFKKSIETEGLLSPLVVAPDMTIISGQQRLKACRELGYKTVPVIIQESILDDEDKLRKRIASNFGRLKNNPIKQSKLIAEYGKLCETVQGGQNKGNNAPISDSSDLCRLKQLQKTTLTADDVQSIMGCGKNNLYILMREAVQKNLFPVKQFGKKYYIPAEPFWKWFNTNTD